MATFLPNASKLSMHQTFPNANPNIVTYTAYVTCNMWHTCNMWDLSSLHTRPTSIIPMHICMHEVAKSMVTDMPHAKFSKRVLLK